MKYKKIKICSVIMLFISITGLQAQETLPAAAGNAFGTDGSVSYTVGQIAYTYNNGTNGNVAQGIQQPYEIFVITGIQETKGMSLQCLVYPNPVTDNLILKIENNEFSKLSFSLFDVNGKLLDNKKVAGKETSINMNSLVSSTYFLKVFNGNIEIQTFKIVKN
jgi:hypothetical protein